MPGLDNITETEKTMTEAESMDASQRVALKDGLIRLIGIPFFGMSIPFATGLQMDIPEKSGVYGLSFIYFTTLAALVWQGNRHLLFRTRRRFTWFEKPVEKLILLVLNNVFYTVPVTVGMLWAWYEWAGPGEVNWSVIRIVALVNVICVLFVTHVYETVFMVKEHQHEQLRSAQLEQARSEAELIALKNQVDPHFMFNSLNTLTYLIATDPAKGLTFTENLAEIYRYILVQKDRPLVLLEDELDFTHKYTDLLHLRFGEALKIKKLFDDGTEKHFLIPPNSVFMAFENAVKHNELSEKHPLQITVDVKDSQLIISNSVRQRAGAVHSSSIGLRNLEERFRLLTGKTVGLQRNGKTFVVSMPLIAV